MPVLKAKMASLQSMLREMKQMVICFSGGVDSALTLCVAVDALGADRVHAVMMPSEFTSQMSLEDAARQAKNIGV